MLFKQQPYVAQFLLTLRSHQRAFFFVREHRLWDGFWKYGWVSRFLIFVAMVMGLKFIGIFVKWIKEASHSDATQMMSVASGMFTDLYDSTFKDLLSGNMHFVMLVLLEVIIFHVTRRTLEKLFGDLPDPTLKDFIRAQVRMFVVGIIALALGKVVTALISIPFSMMGIWWLTKPVVSKIVECFFLGFAVVDNYNEQFHLKIKESLKYTLRYAGVALGVGTVLYVLMAIPLIGPLAGPILASVTATLVMFEVSDLHLHKREELDKLAGDEDVAVHDTV
ncbi:MAG: hypothetical protein ACK4TA_23990 [Saprospiraceae bacterium]